MMPRWRSPTKITAEDEIKTENNSNLQMYPDTPGSTVFVIIPHQEIHKTTSLSSYGFDFRITHLQNLQTKEIRYIRNGNWQWKNSNFKIPDRETRASTLKLNQLMLRSCESCTVLLPDIDKVQPTPSPFLLH